MTGPPSFLLRPKLTSLSVLSFNDWLYDFNDTRFQFFLSFGLFVFFVSFEILSGYPNILILMAPIVLAKTFSGS